MPKVEVTIEVAAPPVAGAAHADRTGEADRLHVLGTLRREDGPEVEFVGWVALLALLQHVVSVP